MPSHGYYSLGTGDTSRARDLNCILTMRYDRGRDTWNDIFGGDTCLVFLAEVPPSVRCKTCQDGVTMDNNVRLPFALEGLSGPVGDKSAEVWGKCETHAECGTRVM